MYATAEDIKKLQPQKVKRYLYKVKSEALANNKYRWGIDIFEKHRRRYAFNNNQLYTLGLLYDHLVMFNKNKKIKKKRANEYLRKAESIYQSILKEEPKSLFALYGLGRVWSIKGNPRKALAYQKRAYRLMQKLPRRGKGALAIGVLYEKMGDHKKAEEWYKKEYNNLKNDFGTTLNLFLFYKRMNNYEKAFLYLPKIERLIKKEFEKDVYRGL